MVYGTVSSYDAASLLQTEQVTTVRSDGTYVADTSYGYGGAVFHSGSGTFTYDGPFQGGVTNAVTTNTKNGVAQPTSEATYGYVWRDGPAESGGELHGEHRAPEPAIGLCHPHLRPGRAAGGGGHR